jgi:DNA-binding NarL/FixJ family response regulator
MNEIRVLIADDHDVVRRGVRSLMDLEDDLVVVAEASDGLEAVEAAQATHPDIVILDLEMPHQDPGRQSFCEDPCADKLCQ